MITLCMGNNISAFLSSDLKGLIQMPNGGPFTDYQIDPNRFQTTDAYVCWLDIMGTESIMHRSLKTALSFVCKLHIAALTAGAHFTPDSIHLYPVMDGLYIVSRRQGVLLAFLHQTLRPLVEIFLHQARPELRFLARGAVAYGPVIEGRDLAICGGFHGDADILRTEAGHTGCIVAGIPVAQAHRFERQAPPFGIFIHESARAFAPAGEDPFVMAYWDWIDVADPAVNRGTLLEALIEYFDWYSKHSLENEYPIDDIEKHKELANEWLLP